LESDYDSDFIRSDSEDRELNSDSDSDDSYWEWLLRYGHQLFGSTSISSNLQNARTEGKKPCTMEEKKKKKWKKAKTVIVNPEKNYNQKKGLIEFGKRELQK